MYFHIEENKTYKKLKFNFLNSNEFNHEDEIEFKHKLYIE